MRSSKLIRSCLRQPSDLLTGAQFELKRVLGFFYGQKPVWFARKLWNASGHFVDQLCNDGAEAAQLCLGSKLAALAARQSRFTFSGPHPVWKNVLSQALLSLRAKVKNTCDNFRNR